MARHQRRNLLALVLQPFAGRELRVATSVALRGREVSSPSPVVHGALTFAAP